MPAVLPDAATEQLLKDETRALAEHLANRKNRYAFVVAVVLDARSPTGISAAIVNRACGRPKRMPKLVAAQIALALAQVTNELTRHAMNEDDGA